MKRVILTAALAVLAFGAIGAHAGQSGNCSLEGTWYGYNSHDAIWLLTISRSGPQSFTTVLDNGVNVVGSPVTASSDWRGELVRTGPTTYDWTTMAQLRAVEGFPFPFAAGHCPWAAEFVDCDTFRGGGDYCTYYGYFPGEDPFVDGVLIDVREGAEAFFKRMPMTLPEP